MDILERLKHETVDQHTALDQIVPLTDPDFTLDDYADYLEGNLAFYSAIEPRLKSVSGLETVVPHMSRRWKTAAIEADLRALGRDPDGAILSARDIPIPEIHTLPQALGVLYVLEGSTLGGQILTRMVRGRFGDRIVPCTNFLASYGSEVRPMWQAFCQAVRNTLREPPRQDSAVAAARSAFECFADWVKKMQKIPMTTQ